jgi:hypothetical protein
MSITNMIIMDKNFFFILDCALTRVQYDSLKEITLMIEVFHGEYIMKVKVV